MWTKVEDGLPPDEEDVIVWLSRPLKYGRRWARSYYYSGQWGAIDGGRYPGMPEVTHWQPAPKEPE